MIRDEGIFTSLTDRKTSSFFVGQRQQTPACPLRRAQEIPGGLVMAKLDMEERKVPRAVEAEE